MNGWLATDPLDISRTAPEAPVHGVIEEFTRKIAAAIGIEGVDPGDAENAAHVASGEIEQVGGDQLGLFAVFNSMAENTGDYARLAGMACRDMPFGMAAMLTQRAIAIVTLRQRQSCGIGPGMDHAAILQLRSPVAPVNATARPVGNEEKSIFQSRF